MRTVPPTEKGKYKAFASGAITNGKPVIVNADGTVSTASFSVTGGFGTAVEFEDAYTSNEKGVAIAFDSSSNKIVLAYQDEGNSGHGTAIVGTVDTSDDSISYGTAIAYTSEGYYI